MIRSFGLSPARAGNHVASRELSEWTPAVDITEDEREYLIVAELPQIAKEDVSVVVENDSLVIKGERRLESDHSDKKVHRIERSYGSFYRSFSLPEDADGNGVTANFKDGVLRVSLPKSEEKKPKQIEVKVD
jgi:HSP20 family protein